MKQLILLSLIASAAFFTGCASTGSRTDPPTHYNETGIPSTDYPDAGSKPSEAYNYARGQSGNEEYSEAARWFEKAAAEPLSTESN